jgi:hypothetical protein
MFFSICCLLDLTVHRTYKTTYDSGTMPVNAMVYGNVEAHFTVKLKGQKRKRVGLTLE